MRCANNCENNKWRKTYEVRKSNLRTKIWLKDIFCARFILFYPKQPYISRAPIGHTVVYVVEVKCSVMILMVFFYFIAAKFFVPHLSPWLFWPILPFFDYTHISACVCSLAFWWTPAWTHDNVARHKATSRL